MAAESASKHARVASDEDEPPFVPPQRTISVPPDLKAALEFTWDELFVRQLVEAKPTDDFCLVATKTLDLLNQDPRSRADMLCPMRSLVGIVALSKERVDRARPLFYEAAIELLARRYTEKELLDAQHRAMITAVATIHDMLTWSQKNLGVMFVKTRRERDYGAAAAERVMAAYNLTQWEVEIAALEAATNSTFTALTELRKTVANDEYWCITANLLSNAQVHFEKAQSMLDIKVTLLHVEDMCTHNIIRSDLHSPNVEHRLAVFVKTAQPWVSRQTTRCTKCHTHH